MRITKKIERRAPRRSKEGRKMVLSVEFEEPITANELAFVTEDPLVDPRVISEAVGKLLLAGRAGQKLRELAVGMKQGRISAVIFKGCHEVLVQPGPTPFGMRPQASDTAWRLHALVTLGLMYCLDLQPVSYDRENGGDMFVHLVVDTVGQGRAASGSRDEMGGHTDLLSFEFAHEFGDCSRTPPAPDFVVLTGIRNPGLTATYIAPLEDLAEVLSSASVDELMRPQFNLARQPSIDEDYDCLSSDRSVISLDPDWGRVIRYSASKVSPDPDSALATEALEDLARVVPRVREGVVVEPGDVFFLNNRLNLHGREKIDVGTTSKDRWLLRSYANRTSTPARYVAGSWHKMQC